MSGLFEGVRSTSRHSASKIAHSLMDEPNMSDKPISECENSVALVASCKCRKYREQVN